MIEVRLLHLETRKLYDQVVEQQKVSERLLLNVLPGPIAVFETLWWAWMLAASSPITFMF